MQTENVAEKRRVLIVEDDVLVGMGHKNQLERLGHTVVGQAATPATALKLYDETQPDMILVDIRLDDTDGISLAVEMLARRRCPIVVVSAFSDPALIERASAAGIFGYLIKPTSGESLAAQMEVAYRRFQEHEALLAQNAHLAQTLENRKTTERAKGIFMKRLSLSEDQAHRRLQAESQKRRISLVELAKRIIESEELLGG